MGLGAGIKAAFATGASMFGAARIAQANTMLAKHGMNHFANFYAFDVGIRVATGESLGHAALHGVGTAAMFTAFPEVWVAHLGLMVAKGAVSAGYGLSYAGNLKFRTQVSRRMGGSYRDNQMSSTMRQRGIQEIQNARINARSALGQEALMVHRRVYDY